MNSKRPVPKVKHINKRKQHIKRTEYGFILSQIWCRVQCHSLTEGAAFTQCWDLETHLQGQLWDFPMVQWLLATCQCLVWEDPVLQGKSALVPQLLKPTHPRVHALQQDRPLQWEACVLHLESTLVRPDPAQPKGEANCCRCFEFQMPMQVLFSIFFQYNYLEFRLTDCEFIVSYHFKVVWPLLCSNEWRVDLE